MAKLKIFENNDAAAGIPSKQGYINVATNLINDFTNFENESDKNRSDLLQGYAGPAHTIFQRTRNPETDDPINSSNCKVNIVFDGRKKPNANFGKHNIVLPEIEPGDSLLSTHYLSGYVKAIHDLHGTGTQLEVEAACNFLFGVMLLGRCR